MEEPGSRTDTGKNRGSSLPTVEILIAIAVVVVVGGLTARVLRGAKNRSGGGSCASNQRMIATALAAYEEQSDGKIVPRYIASGITFDRLLDPFIGSAKVWRCPNDHATGDDLRSIGMNRSVGVIYTGSGPFPSAVDPAAIENPELLIVFSDDAPSPRERPGGPPPSPDRDPSAAHACELVALTKLGKRPVGPQMAPLLRHEGYADVTYADGHSGYTLPVGTLAPKVRWFVNAPPLHRFVPGSIHRQKDCELLGLPGMPVGRDPSTGR